MLDAAGWLGRLAVHDVQRSKLGVHEQAISELQFSHSSTFETECLNADRSSPSRVTRFSRHLGRHRPIDRSLRLSSSVI